MKKKAIFTSVLVSIFFIWVFLNSNWLIIKLAEIEFSEILVAGTSKEDILNILKKKKYHISENSIESPEKYYWRDGKCRSSSDGNTNFKWNCEYPGYIFTRRKAGFFGLTDPSLRLYFVYDNERKLVNYYIGVGHTLL
jgi:hypothetical protein